MDERELEKVYLTIANLSLKVSTLEAILLEKGTFTLEEYQKTIETQSEVLMNKMKEEILKAKENQG